MKKHPYVLVLLISLVSDFINLNAQKTDNIPSLCLNHVYIYLDTVTYHNLFNSSFLSDTLGNCEAHTVKTNDGEYSGKYLFGEEGYLEFFPTKEADTIPSGAVGLGLITFRSGDIWKIREQLQKHATQTIWTDTTFRDNNGLKESWYYAIGLVPKDTNEYLPVWVWLMENTPDCMKKAGFSDSDLKEEIAWSAYYRHRLKSGPYSKLLKRITSVNVSVGSDRMYFLQEIMEGFGLQKLGLTFSNQHANIACDVKPDPIWRIQTVTFELKQDVPYRKLIISDNLFLELEGKSAVFTFK
jgi:hypothetical protein